MTTRIMFQNDNSEKYGKGHVTLMPFWSVQLPKATRVKLSTCMLKLIESYNITKWLHQVIH